MRLCDICGLRPATVVDHCHVTGRCRGMLCRGCNRVAMDPEYLRCVLAYVEASPIGQEYRRFLAGKVNRHRKRLTNRGWYEANRELAREQLRNWRASHRERQRESDRAWYAQNREREAAGQRRWRAARRRDAMARCGQTMLEV